MIPSTNNKLLVSEDWKKIYQSFRNADFKSYDFDTLRRTMIQYLQENYPEDFNDFIESSEYIALIDLIAYLGQNLSFRIDLNARENFLETAQRRDSILRLAQLVSYVPVRNKPATGFLKVTAITTTDNVIDSNGTNLANTPIVWNDATNSNWYQQFMNIMNSSMSGSFAFGKPYDRATIDGILTEQYRINSANNDLPVFSFLKNINGTSMNFEIVPATFSGKTSVYEEAPKPKNTFSLLYRNDNQGSGSSNTGFFVHFRQGNLNFSSFSIDTPVPNEIVGVNAVNINDNDIWLWQLDSSSNYSTLWTKVPSVIGNNIIYNSLNKNERNIYSVTSRDSDQIDLNFADGSFGNLPKGQFRLFYRQSNGLTYSIKPEQMSGIVIEIPYFNKLGQGHTLSLTLGLQYTVSNSSGSETNASIQSKAPQAYYVQNRMVTAEDYNIAPLTISSDILKVKSVNRVSSGLSKFFDLNDISGKYSKTNIFATDGLLYKDDRESSFEFDFLSRNEVYAAIKQQLSDVISSVSMRSFYFDKYPRPEISTSVSAPEFVWNLVNTTSGQCRGYFKVPADIDTPEIPANVGQFTSNNLRYADSGALVKFVPPSGKYFLPNGKLTSIQTDNTTSYLWATVIKVIGDGSNTGQGALDDGTGPVILSNFIDNDAIPLEIIPKFVNILSYSFETEIVNLCVNQRTFGLSFNQITRSWNIISDTNIDLFSNFSLTFQGSVNNSSSDASWLVAFVWTGKNYKVRYRLTDYIFESEKETAFFIDTTDVNYDFVTDTVVKDQITILSLNTQNTNVNKSIGKDFQWQVDSPIVEIDGYTNPKKVKVSLYDFNNLGQISDPDTFNNVVEPASVSPLTGFNDKFVYFKYLSDNQRYQLVDKNLFLAYPSENNVPEVNKIDGQLYYFYNPDINVVKSYSQALEVQGDPWVYESQYFAMPGRSNLKFHYMHNSGDDRRIDPSKSNIVDVYLLTASYDTEYRNWLSSGAGKEPLPPTSSSLEQNYSSNLESIKTISDEIIFQPVKYKILFGSKATSNLQATFKAVRNPSRPISDNEIKTRILSAINAFFALDNWDFGQTFHFSELSTYVMNLLTPDITNFIIVPKSNNNFGSLYEIACLSNEIFISGATTSDIEVIDAITASQLKTTTIITNSGS
jgi:hypothetical protein